MVGGPTLPSAFYIGEAEDDETTDGRLILHVTSPPGFDMTSSPSFVQVSPTVFDTTSPPGSS